MGHAEGGSGENRTSRAHIIIGRRNSLIWNRFYIKRDPTLHARVGMAETKEEVLHEVTADNIDLLLAGATDADKLSEVVQDHADKLRSLRTNLADGEEGVLLTSRHSIEWLTHDYQAGVWVWVDGTRVVVCGAAAPVDLFVASLKGLEVRNRQSTPHTHGLSVQLAASTKCNALPTECGRRVCNASPILPSVPHRPLRRGVRSSGPFSPPYHTHTVVRSRWRLARGIGTRLYTTRRSCAN